MRRQDYVILLHIISERTKEVLQRLKAWTDKFFRQIRDNVGTDLNGRYMLLTSAMLLGAVFLAMFALEEVRECLSATTIAAWFRRENLS